MGMCSVCYTIYSFKSLNIFTDSRMFVCWAGVFRPDAPDTSQEAGGNVQRERQETEQLDGRQGQTPKEEMCDPVIVTVLLPTIHS